MMTGAQGLTSTSLRRRKDRDVDGRDKPGHDVLKRIASSGCPFSVHPRESGDPDKSRVRNRCSLGPRLRGDERAERTTLVLRSSPRKRGSSVRGLRQKSSKPGSPFARGRTGGSPVSSCSALSRASSPHGLFVAGWLSAARDLAARRLQPQHHHVAGSSIIRHLLVRRRRVAA